MASTARTDIASVPVRASVATGGPVWLWFRSELRRRWRSWLVLALLVGVGGGVVIGAAAGARGTDTAYSRFLEASNPVDVSVQAVPFPLDVEAINRLPEVEHAFNTPYAWLNPAPGEPEWEFSPLLVPDLRTAKHDRSKVLEGRRPDPDRADEASVTPVAAKSGAVEIGSTLRLQAWTPEGARAVLQGDRRPPDGVIVEVKIVGVELVPGALLPSEQDEGSILLTPAFARQYGDQIGLVDILHVKLRRGPADIASFKAGVERIAAGTPVQFQNIADDTVQVQRAIHLQAVALRLFALFAGVAALLILGQVLARQALASTDEQPTLAAMGLTRPQRWLATMLPPVTAALIGAALAGVLAVLASPLTPFGIARDAEPDPGMAFDATTVVPGVAAVLVLLGLFVAVPVWRATRTVAAAGSAGAERPSRLAEGVARTGVPPSAVTGVRMAVGAGGGRSAVPTRAALTGTTLSVIALVTALTFAESLHKLIDSPRLYGWNWDALVGDVFFEDLADQVVPGLSENESLAGFSTITLAEADIGGVRTPAFGFATNSGSVFPPIVSGRAPMQPDEVVLGAKTLRAVHRKVGDTVAVRVADNVARLHIVGRGVLPALSGGDIAGLGEGALLTGEGLARFVPDAPRSLFAVRYAEGVSDREGRASLAAFEEDAGVATASPPKRVADFGRVDNLPYVLVGLLGLIAGATLVHALVSAVQRRRHDFAILKTLGFVRRQVSWTVVWQATSLTLVALGLGVPLGAAAGRWSWELFADQLGIVPEPIVPVTTVLLTVPAALLVANAVAALPARAAGRTRPALVLRSE
ncbi:MAG TPA: FtsX-like permease family protein [Acidimicrobiales bacterium]|nr:FtsX-like permease family protein [Acidimicrobiales bacterium]